MRAMSGVDGEISGLNFEVSLGVQLYLKAMFRESDCVKAFNQWGVHTCIF